ncbi:hypothetical protein GCM10023328_32160 [Modestobacter marinus]|uniref:Uncharacterized protein n=1 Tax=Modestobacter marinus TaxID=477641 RepID=A0A846LRD7_9ACTN|nr:hypothetical protein [Modestobacter marinus]NIH67958.1 hypothetical protein [Modestobacter marinus]GGL69967.1 hypothetical protein GCM10011589_27820 [Modestobacter marinus]
MSTAHDGQDAGGQPASGGRHTAGAYDVRVVIAGLIGLYGVVLIVLGIVDYGEAEAAKTGDVNANLWAGLGMLVFALVFVAWTRLRPVVVEDGEAVEDPTGGADTAGR